MTLGDDSRDWSGDEAPEAEGPDPAEGTDLDPDYIMTADQAARMVAVEKAGETLSRSVSLPGGGILKTPATSLFPGKMTDIVDLAEYIVSGNPYQVKHQHECRSMSEGASPMMQFMPVDFEDLPEEVKTIITGMFGGQAPDSPEGL